MKACFLALEPHFCSQIGPVSFAQSILDFRPFGVAQSLPRLSKGQVFDFGFRPNHRSNLKITWRCAALNSSSLLTFSTKAKLPTATASDHRASRTDNCADHIQVNLHQTAMQVLIPFNSSGMITVLSKCPLPSFALVVFLSGAAGNQLHTAGITFGPGSLIRRWT